MNDWTCPNCGALNANSSTTTFCWYCGSSKWVTMPTSAKLSAINYHRIIGEDVAPVPAVTYASFNCPRGVFKCGDNVLCGDCKGFSTHFDKDGKLQNSLNPNVGNVVVTPQNGTYFEDQQSACPDCARLNTELAITKTALQSGVKMISQLYEDCARLRTLVADVWKDYKESGSHYPMRFRKLEARIKQEGI